MRRRPAQAAAAALVVSAALAGACGPAPRPAPAPPPPTPVPTREVPPVVGLALGGGGARGFAEIGVLRVLEQEKIPVGIVVGTSVGSLIGALYADTGRVLDAELHALTITEEDIFDYKALAFLSGGLAKGDRLERFLDANLSHRTIESFRVPFAAVAADLATGTAVVFDRGPAARAVRASCAIPGVFVPVEIGGRTYVDGGVVDPVPARVARQKGAQVVVAVSVPARLPVTAPRTPIEVVTQSITIMAAEIGRLRARDADVVIEPDAGDVAYDDFGKRKRLIEAGEAATRKALPAIRAAIAAATRRVPAPVP